MATNSSGIADTKPMVGRSSSGNRGAGSSCGARERPATIRSPVRLDSDAVIVEPASLLVLRADAHALDHRIDDRVKLLRLARHLLQRHEGLHEITADLRVVP